MTNRTPAAIVLLVVAQALAGCDGTGPTTPSAPSAVSPPSAISPPPVVTAISVNTGSSSGGAPLHITGTGFQMGVTVTFGTASVERRGYDPRVPGGPSGSIHVSTPAHAAGFVNVIVTNPGGQPLRLANAYEYRAQQSFDLNGSWNGGGSDGSHVGVELTIRNDLLISASWSCDGEGLTTVSLSSPAADGEFSADAGDGFRISGRIVSPSDAIGRVAIPSCGSDFAWAATRRHTPDDY